MVAESSLVAKKIASLLNIGNKFFNLNATIVPTVKFLLSSNFIKVVVRPKVYVCLHQIFRKLSPAKLQVDSNRIIFISLFNFLFFTYT